MPVLTPQLQIIISLVIALVAWVHLERDPDDCTSFVDEPVSSQSIVGIQGKDKYSELIGTVLFKPYAGVSEDLLSHPDSCFI